MKFSGLSFNFRKILLLDLFLPFHENDNILNRQKGHILSYIIGVRYDLNDEFLIKKAFIIEFVKIKINNE